jgi:ankyrin repeat protein
MSTPATSEQEKGLFEAALWDCGAEAIPDLVKAGADPNCEEASTGRTPLYVACMGDRVRVIEALLRHGADPSKRFNYRSPVDGRVEADAFAILYASSPQAVSALVNAGAEVDATDANGTTALMRAAFNGKVEVVQALLAAGASPFLRTHKRPRHKARSARELAESKVDFWRKHTDESNRDKVEANLKRYEAICSLLLKAEAKS